MEVFAPTLPKDKFPLPTPSRPGSELLNVPMDSIKLETEEPKAPQTFSTSLTPEHAPAETPAAAPKGKPDFIIPSVHTLRDDMKSVVRDQSMSIVRASALEEQRKQARVRTIDEMGGGAPDTKPIERKRSGFGTIIIAIVVFLLLGVAVGGGFWFYRLSVQAPLAIATDTSGLIFAEQSVSFSLSNSSPSTLKNSLASARTQSVGASAITRLIPTVSTDTSIGGTATTHSATASEFFDAIGAQIPAELMSAIGPDIFIGIHGIDGNQALIILPVTSYEHAFAGMLAWEGSMSDDLAPFFESLPTSLVASDGSVNTNTFKDVVVKNYDVRVQSDAAGNPKLLYSFPNRDLLIITSSPYTLVEALARLQAARKL